jgi:hypothetical protein
MRAAEVIRKAEAHILYQYTFPISVTVLEIITQKGSEGARILSSA